MKRLLTVGIILVSLQACVANPVQNFVNDNRCMFDSPKCDMEQFMRPENHSGGGGYYYDYPAANDALQQSLYQQQILNEMHNQTNALQQQAQALSRANWCAANPDGC